VERKKAEAAEEAVLKTWDIKQKATDLPTLFCPKSCPLTTCPTDSKFKLDVKSAQDNHVLSANFTMPHCPEGFGASGQTMYKMSGCHLGAAAVLIAHLFCTCSKGCTCSLPAVVNGDGNMAFTSRFAAQVVLNNDADSVKIRKLDQSAVQKMGYDGMSATRVAQDSHSKRRETAAQKLAASNVCKASSASNDYGESSGKQNTIPRVSSTFTEGTFRASASSATDDEDKGDEDGALSTAAAGGDDSGNASAATDAKAESVGQSGVSGGSGKRYGVKELRMGESNSVHMSPGDTFNLESHDSSHGNTLGLGDGVSAAGQIGTGYISSHFSLGRPSPVNQNKAVVELRDDDASAKDLFADDPCMKHMFEDLIEQAMQCFGVDGKQFTMGATKGNLGATGTRLCCKKLCKRTNATEPREEPSGRQGAAPSGGKRHGFRVGEDASLRSNERPNYEAPSVTWASGNIPGVKSNNHSIAKVDISGCTKDAGLPENTHMVRIVPCSSADPDSNFFNNIICAAVSLTGSASSDTDTEPLLRSWSRISMMAPSKERMLSESKRGYSELLDLGESVESGGSAYRGGAAFVNESKTQCPPIPVPVEKDYCKEIAGSSDITSEFATIADALVRFAIERLEKIALEKITKSKRR